MAIECIISIQTVKMDLKSIGDAKKYFYVNH